MGFAGDTDTVTDLLQDAFLCLFHYANRIEPDRPLEPWNARITVNLALTWVRRRKWIRPLEDMNCWQSKCHASNHPPEGFELPRFAPKIIGQGTLGRFPTAADLYAFLVERMPWQEPGLFDEETYWQLTAFLLRENGFNLGDEPLSDQNVALVRLRPTTDNDTLGQIGEVLDEKRSDLEITPTGDIQQVPERAVETPSSVIVIALATIVVIGISRWIYQSRQG